MYAEGEEMKKLLTQYETKVSFYFLRFDVSDTFSTQYSSSTVLEPTEEGGAGGTQTVSIRAEAEGADRGTGSSHQYSCRR